MWGLIVGLVLSIDATKVGRMCLANLLDQNPFDLIQSDFIAAAIIELRRSG
jgi:hypothetical protein